MYNVARAESEVPRARTDGLSTGSRALSRSKRLPRRGRCGARRCRCRRRRWALAGAGLGASALLSGLGARGCSTSGGDVGVPVLCVCRDFFREPLGFRLPHGAPAWRRGCGDNPPSPLPDPGLGAASPVSPLPDASRVGCMWGKRGVFPPDVFRKQQRNPRSILRLCRAGRAEPPGFPGSPRALAGSSGAVRAALAARRGPWPPCARGVAAARRAHVSPAACGGLRCPFWGPEV